MARTQAAQVRYSEEPEKKLRDTRRNSARKRKQKIRRSRGPYARPRINEPERAPGSPTTIYEDFNTEQYDNQSINPKDSFDQPDSDSKSSFEENPGWSTAAASMLGSLSNKGKKGRGTTKYAERIAKTGAVLEICTWIYGLQLFFWFVSITGIVLETGVLGGTISGLEIFYFGYLIAAFLGWAQLLAAAVIYRINPLVEHDVYFYIAASLCWMPGFGGFFPWVLLWIYDILGTGPGK